MSQLSAAGSLADGKRKRGEGFDLKRTQVTGAPTWSVFEDETESHFLPVTGFYRYMQSWGWSINTHLMQLESERWTQTAWNNVALPETCRSICSVGLHTGAVYVWSQYVNGGGSCMSSPEHWSASECNIHQIKKWSKVQKKALLLD